MLLAITKFELTDIRKALLASSKREEGYQQKLSDGLRVINAILDKSIEVVPAHQSVEIEQEEQFLIAENIYTSYYEESTEESNDGC